MGPRHGRWVAGRRAGSAPGAPKPHRCSYLVVLAMALLLGPLGGGVPALLALTNAAGQEVPNEASSWHPERFDSTPRTHHPGDYATTRRSEMLRGGNLGRAVQARPWLESTWFQTLIEQMITVRST